MFLWPWDFPGKNAGVSSYFLLQGIFPTQGSNLRLLHWQMIFFTKEPPRKPWTTVSGEDYLCEWIPQNKTFWLAMANQAINVGNKYFKIAIKVHRSPTASTSPPSWKHGEWKASRPYYYLSILWGTMNRRASWLALCPDQAQVLSPPPYRQVRPQRLNMTQVKMQKSPFDFLQK